MELKTTADGNSYIIEVEKKKASKTGIIARTLSLLTGAFFIAIGVILCITIIGAIVGIPLIIFGLPFIVGSFGFQRIECPNCSRKQIVKKGSGKFKCQSCNKNTLIEWK
ncbi:hypothetical protein QJ529_18615 [Bacillus paranthracis]|uniref:DUF5362 family protein n=1 Tax=Bacillus TaxID=1386 RepID=UPI000CCC9BF2|nr:MULTISPECIES: hypothetical protein [Bacillus]MDO3374681.1 hypothetical protein [Bacillus paranthracis]PNS30829.1 hypothetical protein C1640_18840 [Bacillus sp. AKBS9]